MEASTETNDLEEDTKFEQNKRVISVNIKDVITEEEDSLMMTTTTSSLTLRNNSVWQNLYGCVDQILDHCMEASSLYAQN